MPAHLRFGLRALVRRPELAARSGTRVMRFVERHPEGLARLARLGATPADRRLLAAAEGGTLAVESFLAAAAALPRCRARFDAQEGHFFFRRRLADVLGALVEAVRV
jgi:hypothetical protein